MTSPSSTLTRNPQAGTYGYTCTEHGIHRYGLTQQHAINVEAKHLREHHDPMATLAANLSIDLTHAAMYAAAAYHDPKPRTHDAIAMWEALTGLPTEEAQALAIWLLGAEPHVTAAVIP
jgi:hypothetical protein